MVYEVSHIVHFGTVLRKSARISRNLAVAQVHGVPEEPEPTAEQLEPSARECEKDTAYDSEQNHQQRHLVRSDIMADKKNGAPAGKRPRDVAGDHALAELLDRLLGAYLPDQVPGIPTA